MEKLTELKGLTHYEEDGNVYFNVHSQKLSTIIGYALTLAETPTDYLAAAHLLARAEVPLEGKMPKDLIFMDTDCDLIIQGLYKYADKASQADLIGAMWAISADRIILDINQALSEAGRLPIERAA
jgi:hypothetical protein